MSIFAEAAQRLAEAAAALEDRVAMDVCEAQALVFQHIEREITPKKTGALADSETIEGLAGGGSRAEANVAPHKIYAQIRNDGGTISAKNHPVLGNPAVGWFGKMVVQHGTHYVERSRAAAQGPSRQAAQAVIDAILGGIF